MTSIPWQGTILGVQPRIRLTRSFDERTHTYLGYALHLDGTVGGQRDDFPSIASALATSCGASRSPWPIRAASRWTTTRRSGSSC